MALMLMPDAYRALIRPLLFRLPPETAQRVADAALKLTPVWRALGPVLEYSHPALKTTVAGLELRNPVGLAAGYDKNCEYLTSLAALGFGYVTGGTVTPMAQPGNPRPRIVRHRRQESLVNSLGFPGQGLDRAVARLQATAGTAGAPIVASVSGVTIDEIVTCHRRIEPLVSAVEINISSPNTEGLRAFHEGPVLAELLEAVNAARRKPLFVKVPPFRSEGDASDQRNERTLMLGLIGVCAEHRVDGLTVANTWPVRDAALAVGHGGLSGKPVFDDMLRMVSEVRSAVGGSVAINACGGIFSGEDAWRALRAGADTVQLFTGLIYRGPGIVRGINRDLARRLDRYGLDSVAGVRDLPVSAGR